MRRSEMHYANGRAAKIGDLVCGKGYNVKYEIVGVLTFANPGATACNCTVAHIGPQSVPVAKGWRDADGKLVYPRVDGGDVVPSHFESSLEYVQLDPFGPTHPAPEDVLPATPHAPPACT